MKQEMQVSISPEIYQMIMAKQIADLQNQLAEKEALLATIAQPADKTSKEKIVRQEYSEFKSDGKRKARPADSIRSYSDFVAMQKYYLDRGRIRDWTMWTVGVSLGLRVSDLLSLKFNNLIDQSGQFMNRIKIYEQKTGKLNDCLITESVKDAVSKYISTLKAFDPNGYLFPSHKTGGKMYEEHGWRILSQAGKDLGLPLNIGSHTMRKSFANIAACVDRSVIDMNTVSKVQGLLNHSDPKCTMRYLGTFKTMYDHAREAVSDFVLGKTDIDELIAGSQQSATESIINKLDELESLLQENNEK